MDRTREYTETHRNPHNLGTADHCHPAGAAGDMGVVGYLPPGMDDSAHYLWPSCRLCHGGAPIPWHRPNPYPTLLGLDARHGGGPMDERCRIMTWCTPSRTFTSVHTTTLSDAPNAEGVDVDCTCQGWRIYTDAKRRKGPRTCVHVQTLAGEIARWRQAPVAVDVTDMTVSARWIDETSPL